jgi:hypothetical protein
MSKRLLLIVLVGGVLLTGASSVIGRTTDSVSSLGPSWNYQAYGYPEKYYTYKENMGSVVCPNSEPNCDYHVTRQFSVVKLAVDFLIWCAVSLGIIYAVKLTRA